LIFKKWANTMQHDASDCAAAVISTVLLTYKKEMTIMKIREIIGTDAYGTTVKGVMDGLEKLHFKAKAIRTRVDELTTELTYPAIAQVRTEEGLNHFVVIHKVDKKKQIILGDPAKGIVKLEKDKFDEIFSGVVIFMTPTSAFEMLKMKDKGMFSLFTSLIVPQKKLLAAIILASILLTALG
jgi:ATP-binding cassette, subfamily C, bacteriocin exporter